MIFLLLILSPVSAYNYYAIEWYGSNSSGDVFVPTFYSPNITISESDITMISYADLNGTSYSATSNFYSPHNSLIASSERSFTSNQTCVSFGNHTAESFETRNVLSDNADNSFNTLNTIFKIEPAENTIEFHANTYPYDSSDRSFNTFFIKRSGTTLFLNQTFVNDEAYAKMNDFANNYDSCSNFYGSSGRDDVTYTITPSGSRYNVYTRFFVFNSSQIGVFNYSYLIDDVGCSCPNPYLCENYFYKVGYYELETGTSWNDIGISSSGNGQLTLSKNTIYVFQMTSSIRVLSTHASNQNCNLKEYLYNNTYSLGVPFPVWECSDYSECINGTRFRTCIDLDGQVPDKIETEFCYVAPVESFYLGFENFTNVDVWYAYSNFLCACGTELKSVKYPTDEWVVLNPNATDESFTPDKIGFTHDFIKITSEDSYEGDRSLKMWYLPPQPFLPRQTGTPVSIVSCQNTSSGTFPDIYQIISTNNTTSIFVERNITLPTPYMSVSFKAKKCNIPELESSTPDLFGFKYCGEDWYYSHSKSKNEDVKGTITYYLKDTATGSFLYDIKSEIIYGNKWEIREYAIDSLEPNKNYTLGLAVVPESETEFTSYCVYVDDLNIDIRNVPLICESECDDDRTEIERTCKEYVNNVCVVCEETEIINSPNCLTSESVIDKVESCESFCGCEEYEIGDENYYTKYVGNILEDCNVTVYGVDSCCQYNNIEDSEFCVDFCEKYEAGEGIDLFKPIDYVSDRFEEADLPEWSANFFSPIMIIFYIIIIIMSFVTYKTESWQVGVITALLFLIAIGTLFPQMMWIVIVIIIVSGFILAKSITPFTQ